MVTYIYFVKCPNCEDEHFDFFDDAKAFAMGCLSQKPIITQTEVCRNDFGECTDHCDLGTVWSWEDMMSKETDAESATSVFTKDDFADFEGAYNPENDPEFYEMDNSVDCEPEISEVSPVERKPVPEGMTIEQLVEEMEENEDTVECVLCQDLFDKSTCRKELNLGWLCRRCADDLVARGEGPVFKEDNYWDFLDEEVEPTEKKTWLVFSGDNPIEVGEVYANTEEEAVAEAERKFPDLNYNDYDGAVQVVPADEDLTETTEIHNLGNEYNGGYPDETSEVSDSHLKLCPECGKEAFDIETGICVECGFN